MTAATLADLRWLSCATARLHSADSPAALAQAVIEEVATAFRATLSGLEEVSYDLCRYAVHGYAAVQPLPPDYEACIHDHPIIPRIAARNCEGVMHLASYAPQAVWERTSQYQGLARRMGWADQMAILALGEAGVASCSLWRDEPYTSAERTRADLLLPHFQAAWVRVATPTRAAGSVPSAWLAVRSTQGGFRIEPDPVQRALLRSYFPGWREGGVLPEPVARWVAAGIARVTAFPPQPPVLLSAESVRGRLLLRLFPPSVEQPLRIRLIERTAEPGYLSLRNSGLTARECEVLHWIAQGKRDSEAAAILGCSAATVSKHVERILTKLDARNRTDAVARALDRLGTSEQGPNR